MRDCTARLGETLDGERRAHLKFARAERAAVRASIGRRSAELGRSRRCYDLAAMKSHTALFVLVSILGLCSFGGDAKVANGDAPLRVFLRGGVKTHGENEHEHERWIGAWKKLLTERGAKVDGGMDFPTAAQLDASDVMVMYCADGGSIHGAERANLEKFLARGGGLVVLHDAVVGDDPNWWKTVIGGAWENGKAKWKNGNVPLCFQDFEHPITKNAANFDFQDEIYFDLNMQPDVHVLATDYRTIFDFEPQMWTYEKDHYRAFVSIQGHDWKSFEHPAWRALLMRGIAWAGKRDADLLTTEAERRDLPYPPGGPIRPELASHKIEVDKDFDLSLVAAEPLIAKAISMDWDARGRMWVAETPGYPEKSQFSGKPARDHIDILSDTDGDGRMDKADVFCDGLDLVTSFVFHKDGVIATAAPDIWFLEDTDGDGKCDKRTKLFTGFGFGDTHAVMSNLRWGLDGWIYATQGYSGGSSDVYGPDALGHQHFGRIGNGIFRFKPDGSAIEMVSSYGSNTWGLDFTWDGELLFGMANGSHIRHVVVPEKALAGGRLPGVETWKDIADHDRVYPLMHHDDAPYAQIDFVGGFTAAAGMCVYTGGAWPAKYDNACFSTEPTVNLVHVDFLKPDGVSFIASKEPGKEQSEFIAGTDLWFRPIHVRVGPDGAIYVIDFYNQAVVHNDTRGPQHGPTNAAWRPDRDHQHGRIWRVQSKQAKKLDQPKLAGATQKELVAVLEHPNEWYRLTAQRLLCEAPKSEVTNELLAVAEHGANTKARVHALWTLASRGLTSGSRWMLDEFWNDADPSVQKNALQALLIARPDDRPSITPASRVDGRVRLIASMVTDTNGFDDFDPLLTTFEWTGDPWTRSVILSRANELTTAETIASAWDRSTNEALRPLFDGIAENLGRRHQFDVIEKVIGTLALKVDHGAVVSSALDRMRSALDANTPGASDELLRALATLLAAKDVDVGIAALPFAAKFNRDGKLDAPIQALGDKLGKQLADHSASTETRTRVLRALFGMPSRRAQAIAAAQSLFDPSEAPELRTAAIDELGGANDDASNAALAKAFGGLIGQAREQAFAKLVARATSANALLAEIESGSIKPNDLGTRGISQLRNHPDAAVAKRANALFDRLTGSAPNIDALIAKLEPEVDKPGNAAHGAELFKTNCVVCHTFRGEGGKVGPDITGMGAHGAHELLPSLLDPSRTVEAAYLEYIAVTNDERIFTGVLVRDTAQSIVLRSSTGEAEVRRDELASLKSSGRSPMPTGFESLGAEGLRDLFAFLSSGYEGYRTIDLRSFTNASTALGMYDPKNDPNPLVFVKWGVQVIDGVPYDVLDPQTRPDSNNVITLKGGTRNWHSKTLVQKVEIPIGYALNSVHVLGGIGGWAHGWSHDVKPIAKWTWKFADGTSEVLELNDGVEFADWIRHVDVPGSKYCEGVIRDDSAGQVRTFEVAPKKKAVVASITIESFDNDQAPTWVALTAELPGAKKMEPKKPDAPPNPEVLILGGGSSHDFVKYFGGTDVETLKKSGVSSLAYVEDVSFVQTSLSGAKALIVSTNQAYDAPSQKAFSEWIARGGALIALHPANWVNQPEWTDYNARFIGGGTKSHESYAEFEVTVVDAKHPLALNVPTKFRVKDELYRFEHAPTDAAIHVIATGKSLSTGAEYPVVWTVERAKGRTACITLGHDASAHDSDGYRALLVNALKWTEGN